MDAPLYEPGDVLYLKESAALGFLEAVTINSVQWGASTQWRQAGWVYTILAGGVMPRGARYGEHTLSVNGAVLYYTEDELVPACDAMELVEANLTRQLTVIQAQRNAICGIT